MAQMTVKKVSVWTATALVPVALMAQERIAQDPHDSLRAVNAALLQQGGIPESCLADVMGQASDACPNGCMIRVPNSSLPKADACDKRTWICDWPTQPVGETLACPAGWTGTFTQDHYYKVQDCGTTLADTGNRTVLSISCKRDDEETRVEPCPKDGHWTGGGVTYSRFHTKFLDKDLATIKDGPVSEWVIKSVDCKRTVNRETYEVCPYLTSACMVESIGGVETANSCTGGRPTGQVNVYHHIEMQHLANDLVSVVVDSTTGGTERDVTTCGPNFPNQPPRVGNDPSADSSGGCFSFDSNNSACADLCARGTNNNTSGVQLPSSCPQFGDGDPLVIDMEGHGLDILGEDESAAVFDWSGRGTPAKTAWFGKGNGLLVNDINRNGKVDGVSEVFGGDAGGALALLAAEDINHDGVIDAKDKVWKTLRLWQDTHGDGISGKGELMTMAQAGIRSISLAFVEDGRELKRVKVKARATVTMEDGDTRAMYEVVF